MKLSIPRRKINEKVALNKLVSLTKKISKDGEHVEYSDLQLTWNYDVLKNSIKYLPEKPNKLIGIGSFQGALEITLSEYFKKVICVDHESFLPKWKPKNVVFHQADIDTNDWKMPEGEGMFDVCYLIETIEHLLWSALPLLKWIKTNSHLAVISTPDDDEWPSMNINPWTRYQDFKSIPSAFPGATSNPEPMNHCKQYNQAEFIQMLDFVGFRVVEFFRTGAGGHQMVAIVQPRN